MERAQGVCGELVLRRAGEQGEHYEIIADGNFLMATYNRRSEELLAKEGLAYWAELRRAAGCAAGESPRVLVGGLGVGHTVTAVLAAEPSARCDVVELEPAVVDWHSRYLAPFSGNPLEDPRVRLLVGDVWEQVRQTALHHPESYDLILIDTDNGPDWLVSPSNSRLYSSDGLATARAALKVPGVAAFWSASSAPAFARRLWTCFRHTRTRRFRPEAAPQQAPDVVYFGLKLTA